LALQIATDLVESYPDGVYFVNLAPLRDSDQVLLTIAQTLALREMGGQTFQVLLKASLQDKHLLLVLDNFEQVITAAPLLTELLEACPELKLLVTSREVLHLRAEHQFPLPPLALPDLTHLPAGNVLAQYAAVDLFLQRAQAVKPSFQLTSTNARSVAEICIRLDGLPLAIELAAARIKLLTPQALLARLSHRLQVLTSGTRDVPARQQTLRNTIEWSYHLLDASEQRLFRRLSVFVGGCTLEEAEAVCATLGDEAELVLDGVASLADKSLLQQTEQGGEEPRLVMLETLREYGLEALAASGEMEAVRQAHALYYLALAEEAESTLEGSQQAAWLERLEREHDNLRVALRWSLERGEAEQGTGDGGEMALRFGVALRRFWNIHGHWSEGRTFLERTLAASEGIASAARVKALTAAASFAVYQCDLDRREALCRESLVQSRERGDTAGTVFTLFLLSTLAWTRGELAIARSLVEESLALCKEVDNTKDIAWSLYYLADRAYEQGEYARALALFEESLAMDRELGNARGIAMSLHGVALTLFVSQSDPAAVRPLLEESLALSRELGDKVGIAHCLSLSGLVALQQGDATTARRLAEESVALSRETGDPYSTAWFLGVLGRVVAQQGDHRAARALYEEGLAIARKIGHKLDIPFFLEGMASLLAAQGEPVQAARLWGAAEDLRESMGVPIWPVERAAYERAVERVRAQLGEKAFAAAWAEGCTMTPEQAFAALQQASLPEPVSKLPSLPTSPNDLTPREMDVLRLLAQGLTSAQMAERLVIGLVTVNSHVRSIYSKLGVTTRAVATRYALEHHLL
jgi:predicted ATPase/DNA-binding CsgD family transcriptional regulator